MCSKIVSLLDDFDEHIKRLEKKVVDLKIDKLKIDKEFLLSGIRLNEKIYKNRIELSN